jgi:hypothetical protein
MTRHLPALLLYRILHFFLAEINLFAEKFLTTPRDSAMLNADRQFPGKETRG